MIVGERPGLTVSDSLGIYPGGRQPVGDHDGDLGRRDPREGGMTLRGEHPAEIRARRRGGWRSATTRPPAWARLCA
jgi:hypothetical protein